MRERFARENKALRLELERTRMDLLATQDRLDTAEEELIALRADQADHKQKDHKK